MNDRIIKAEKLAFILSTTRNQANRSQRYMAQALGKSVGTIQNWESGIGVPNILDTLEWFDILETNAFNHLFALIYPGTNKSCISNQSSDEDLKEALLLYIRDVASTDEIRKLSYSIFGQTGSIWLCQLDMLTAHNHTSMMARVLAAQTIYNSFVMEKAQGTLICEDDVMPNEENLHKSILNCKKAVFKGKSKYEI